MKHLLTIVFFLVNTMVLLSQEECSKMKSRLKNEKSNTLSISQIKETEKYDVHFYSLDLSLTNTATDISGIVEIHAKTRENLDSALFELFSSLTINEIKVNGTSCNFKRNLNSVKVPVNLAKNSFFIISINYSGIPPTNGTNPMGGAGLTSRIETKYNKQITSSLSEPYSAFEWWPCKQSLTDKADSCEVKITVPNNCKAGSNGLLKKTVNLGNGNIRFEWKHNHPIAYYLISVAVGEYIDYSIYCNLEDYANPILIQNYIYDTPECLTDWKSNIDATSDYIKLFSKLYGIYPFYNEKYGHCMAPIGGGMEHQTMTTQSSFNKNLTAHELGHQWFGDHVTCASWADIWVNEGFATYSQYLMLEHLYPAEKKMQMQSYHDAAMQYFDGSVYVIDTLNTKRIFNYRLSYAKGAAIINTMRFVINNDSLFFQGLRNFQKKFGNSTATGLDVKKSLEEVSGIDLTSLFEEWYYGEGYPTYKLKWNIIGYDLSLEIAQYGSGQFLTQKFTNPLEISFARENESDTTIRFEISELVNHYLIKNIGRITKVNEIDPNNWIINKNDTIIKDSNFEVFPDSNSKPSENSIIITPNPSEGVFMLVAKSPGKHSFKIMDTKGKLVTKNDFDKDILIDITNQAQGEYLLFVKSEYGSTQTCRIIKLN
jgi:aminopeptidase N